MLKDCARQVEFQKEWNYVREFQCNLQAHLNAANGATHKLREVTHNILLLFAFSVFENVLLQLKHEGTFTSKDNKLGSLMHGSKNNLTWVNFKLVDEAREKRNGITHDKNIISRKDCWEYIDAIENELFGWGVTERQVIFQH